MSLSFLPKWRAESVLEITPAFLKSQNIELLMMDFDNTIVPYTTNTPTREVMQWLKDLQNAGVKLCVVSNSKKQRVPFFCKENGLDCITHSKKPFPKGIRQCLQKYNIDPKNAAIVGDQIFTDTLGGNGCKVTSILVQPIHNHNLPLKARYVLELPMRFISKNRRISK